MAGNFSKTTKEVWEQVKQDYFTGNWKTIAELAERYFINPDTLKSRIHHHKWNQEKFAMQRTLSNKVEAIKEDLAKSYLKRAYERTIRYEKIIDVSQENFGSKAADGTPLLDPEAINDYTLAETRIHELAKSALRIPDVKKDLDLTSKGQSIGESLVSAIYSLRENAESVPTLTDEDFKRVMEAEIVDDDVATSSNND